MWKMLLQRFCIAVWGLITATIGFILYFVTQVKTVDAISNAADFINHLKWFPCPKWLQPKNADAIVQWGCKGAIVVGLLWFLGVMLFWTSSNNREQNQIRKKKARLSDLRKSEDSFDRWSNFRVQWELMDKNLNGSVQLSIARGANAALRDMQSAVKSLLPLCVYFEINCNVLAMIRDEGHRFALAGGDRGFVEDRREIAKTFDLLAARFQYGVLDTQPPTRAPETSIADAGARSGQKPLSKEDTYKEFMGFGNLCYELRDAPSTHTLDLPGDISVSLQCILQAAKQAAFLRNMLIDIEARANILRNTQKVLEKLLFTDMPAARTAFRPVEQRLILARASLRGDPLIGYNNKGFPSAHEAVLRFAEDVAGSCGVTSQERYLPQISQYQAIGNRLALLPQIDSQTMVGEMKREAIEAASNRLLLSNSDRDQARQGLNAIWAAYTTFRKGAENSDLLDLLTLAQAVLIHGGIVGHVAVRLKVPTKGLLQLGRNSEGGVIL